MSSLMYSDNGTRQIKIDVVQDSTYQFHPVLDSTYLYMPSLEIIQASSLREELRRIRAEHVDLYSALANDRFS